MGRDTLDAAIESVLNQTLPAAEIIVVAGNHLIVSKENLKQIKVIENFRLDNNVWTAAHNRNVGVQAARFDFVAFLDDDDTWQADKMIKQIGFLSQNPGFISLSSAVYKMRPWLHYKRPFKALRNNQDVLAAHYGKKRFLPTPYYTPTPGIVVPTEIAKAIPFDELLLGFEDTWWLHIVQQKGFKIHQFRQALITVNANPVRSIARDSLEKNISWAKKLAESDPALAVNYFQGICLRNAIIARRWRDIKFYLNPSKFDVLDR